MRSRVVGLSATRARKMVGQLCPAPVCSAPRARTARRPRVLLLDEADARSHGALFVPSFRCTRASPLAVHVLDRDASHGGGVRAPATQVGRDASWARRGRGCSHAGVAVASRYVDGLSTQPSGARRRIGVASAATAARSDEGWTVVEDRLEIDGGDDAAAMLRSLWPRPSPDRAVRPVVMAPIGELIDRAIGRMCAAMMARSRLERRVAGGEQLASAALCVSCFPSRHWLTIIPVTSSRRPSQVHGRPSLRRKAASISPSSFWERPC